jgi:YesN/AraC family two-component response regulator
LLKYPNEDLLNYLKGEIDSVNLISFDQIKAETSLNSFSKNPKKILLVDDDEVALFYNKRMIELYMGAESIETISNPKLVPDFFKLNKSNIDLMILDLNMPKLNGLELLDILQKIGLSCPTIILSYNLSEVDQKNLAIFNVIEIWSKPLTEDQIKDFME